MTITVGAELDEDEDELLSDTELDELLCGCKLDRDEAALLTDKALLVVAIELIDATELTALLEELTALELELLAPPPPPPPHAVSATLMTSIGNIF